MIKSIHKSFSKQDLVDIINTLDLPVVFSHANNKNDIQEKLNDLFENNKDITFEDNVYKVKSIHELHIFLCGKNPKKTLNVKEKKQVMTICKEIVKYCKNGYVLMKTNYKTEKDLEDDMLFIIQFGDLPSVRRVCRLMNENIMKTRNYYPIISPQVQKELDEKNKNKQVNQYCFQLQKGHFVVSFS